MCLLKNIYNEFVIYYYRINTSELDYNKMLALADLYILLTIRMDMV